MPRFENQGEGRAAHLAFVGGRVVDMGTLGAFDRIGTHWIPLAHLSFRKTLESERQQIAQSVVTPNALRFNDLDPTTMKW